MPDGKLSEREYKLFRNWLVRQGWQFPFGIGTPENREGIRESSQYQNWMRSGDAPTAVSQRTAGIMGEALPPRATVAPPTPGEQAEVLGVIRDVERPPAPSDAQYKPPVRWETVTEGGWKYDVGYDEDGKVVSRNPLGRAQEEEAGMPAGMWKTYEEALSGAPEGYRPKQTPQGWWGLVMAPTAAPTQGMPEGLFKTYQEAADAAPSGYTPVQQAGGWWGLKAPEAVSPYQQQQLGLQRQQISQAQGQFQQGLSFQREQVQVAQQEAERQERARLGAQPISWLQFAQYTGEQPVVQPWMLPLQPEEAGFRIGETIPGFTQDTLANLPELQRPSAQMWARMGPTAQQQFLGYRQARTGARPEETQFRLQAASPPGGQFGGLRWAR